METRIAFESSEPLVSRQGTDKKVNIEINSKKIQNANTYRENLKATEYVFFSSHIQGSDRTTSQNKISLASIELAVDIRENRPQSFDTNDVAKAHKELTNFKETSKKQTWFNQELENRVNRLINVLEIKLSSLNQAVQVEKAAQNAATKLIRKNENDAFFDGLLEKLKIPETVRNPVYLAALTAINIRDKPSEQESNQRIQDAYNKLTNFRDAYKTLEGFDVVSDMLDNLITVLEKKLSSTEKTAQT